MEYTNRDNESVVRTDKEKKNPKEVVSFVDNRIQHKKISDLNKAIQRSTVSAYSGEKDREIMNEANDFHLINGTGLRYHLNRERKFQPIEIKHPKHHPRIPAENGTLHLFAHGNPAKFGDLKPIELKTLIIDKLKPASVVFHSCFSTGGMDRYDPAEHGPIIAGETARISGVTTKGYSAPIKTIKGTDIIGLDSDSLGMISAQQKAVILQKINSATIKGAFFRRRADFDSLENFDKDVRVLAPTQQMNILSQLLEEVKAEFDKRGNPKR